MILIYPTVQGVLHAHYPLRLNILPAGIISGVVLLLQEQCRHQFALGTSMWMAYANGFCVTSRNTPVTLLTNFQLVPGYAVTSFAFQDSRNLGFMLKLGCKAPNTTHPDIIIAPSHFWFFWITEDSYPQPYLLL